MGKQILDSLPNHPRHHLEHRDAGLDLVRFTALILMVFAHFPTSYNSPFISAMYFIAGSAPALFYFAFGMTFSTFAQKTTIIRLRITFALFIVAIFLNLAFSEKFIYNEFFFFLWLSQCAMMAIIYLIKKPIVFILPFICSTLACMIILPHGYISQLFTSLVGGNFPFLPWFIFVLAGYLFSQRPLPSIVTALVLLAVALSLHFSGLPNTTIEKYPLSVTYIMFFAGFTILVYGLGKRLPGLSHSTMVVYISQNLLLAAILHYMTYDMILLINYPIKHLIGYDVLTNYPNAVMIVLPIVCIAILVALLRTAVTVWIIMKKTNFTKAKIIPNSITAAIAIVMIYYIMSFLSNASMLVATRLILISGMAYFGFVMREAGTMEYMDTDIIYLKTKQMIANCIRFAGRR
jgi:hypothetical protein